MRQIDLLLPDVQAFIREHTGGDTGKLALKKNPFPALHYPDIVAQVAARTKAERKLPAWFAAENIIYPSKVSLEQTSSEATALYKAGLVSGDALIDLTGGFGVDDFYFSKAVKQVVHCEMDEALSEIAAHNFTVLGAANIICKKGKSETILQDENRHFDWMYIDPSRRHDTKGKIFLLSDCLPNVPELLPLYLKYTDSILVKTAPLLDITAGLTELENVSEVHIVAVDNDVKEMLWVIQKQHVGPLRFKTLNISKGKLQEFAFFPDNATAATYSLPKEFLYEPNAAIMKSGAFDEIAVAFEVDKLHKHSHLYTSGSLIPDFPGRIFKVENTISYGKEDMKLFLQGTKANITVRNFPETTEAIRKKWKIQDGGERYCFFTTDQENHKIVLLCSKIE